MKTGKIFKDWMLFILSHECDVYFNANMASWEPYSLLLVNEHDFNRTIKRHVFHSLDSALNLCHNVTADLSEKKILEMSWFRKIMNLVNHATHRGEHLAP